MDTRITPFGNHPDGGKISELKENEPIPDHMMPISPEAQKILETIPQDQRMNYVLNSKEPKLHAKRLWLEIKISEQTHK